MEDLINKFLEGNAPPFAIFCALCLVIMYYTLRQPPKEEEHEPLQIDLNIRTPTNR